MIDSFKIYSELWGYNNYILFNRSDSDFLIDDDGLDWGEVTSEVSTINNLDSIGSTLNAVETSKPRPISIAGWVVGTEDEMKAKKNLLRTILTPQYNLRILIPNEDEPPYNYYIDTRLTEGLKFDPAYKANNEVMCKFSFSLEAAYPFFCFDRSYAGDPGTVLNYGSIPVGVRVRASISGTSNITFQAGQNYHSFSMIDATGVLDVDTRRGLRQLTLGSQKAFHYLDPYTTDWLQVPPSLTGVSVTARNADILSIDFTEAHAVLKGM